MPRTQIIVNVNAKKSSSAPKKSAVKTTKTTTTTTTYSNGTKVKIIVDKKK